MPTQYKAPVEELVFLIHEVIAPGGGHLPPDSSPDETRRILEQAARFFEEVWAPLDAAGDDEGCSIHLGDVRTPRGFKGAHDACRAAGWNSITAPLEYGGAGLPELIGQAVREFAASSNNSLGLYGGLTNAAHATVRRNGEPWMLRHVVPRMVSGEWAGTMCLTEPHCGTDLRLMKTRAAVRPDGSFTIRGTKIFITGGDHDLAENIVHLVLAKLPQEDGRYADDLSGVTLFLVPKRSIDPQTGAIGAPNGVTVGGVERKMGLKGSATCTLYFEDAIGFRLGNPAAAHNAGKASSAGMAGMFEMMNSARVGTGLQALASAQRAYAHSADYARTRLAGRAAVPEHRTPGAADPIIVHPDVRRLLMKQASFIEAGRALGMYVRSLLDEPDPGRRESSAAMGALLTPVVKAYLTDRAFESTNDAMQVMGGHGYIHDNGVEQLVRDARIFQLYEGANGVQALDLVTRKLPARGGRPFAEFIEMLKTAAAEASRNEQLFEHAKALMHASGDLEACGAWMLDKRRNPNDLGGSSYDFLTLMGTCSLGFMWILMSAAVLGQRDRRESPFGARKLALAHYWFEREMPIITALRVRIESGHESLMALEADLF